MILKCCLLVLQLQCVKQYQKIVEKLVKTHILDDFLPLKHTIVKNYSMLYCDIENNILQSSNESISHGIVTLVTHRTGIFSLAFSSCIVYLHKKLT